VRKNHDPAPDFAIEASFIDKIVEIWPALVGFFKF
jgi:hypothetical protein